MKPAVMSFVVAGPPVAKERPRLGAKGRTYTPERTLAYERLVHGIASLHVPPGWDTKASMRIVLKVYTATKRRIDVDNVAKALLDGMQASKRKGRRGVFDDDSQVVRLEVVKAIDRERPRVEVTVWRTT